MILEIQFSSNSLNICFNVAQEFEASSNPVTTLMKAFKHFYFSPNF